ncbi:MAG: DUF4860 domain-containing protein [Ruminococcaceae bacterium]|nr:DUF4860 domain-containing protein [Oscillospiraceae bacterium]
MKKNGTENRISVIAALLLLALFAVFAVAVLVSGVRIADKVITERDGARLCRDTVQYVTARFRQSQSTAVSVEDFHGQPALVFSEDIGGEVYLTRIYCYDGYLRELFAEDGIEMGAEDGEKLLSLAKLEVREERGGAHLSFMWENGETGQVFLYREDLPVVDEVTE